MRSRCRGLALLIVIGVLGVLALLAVAFVTMARLERRASESRTASTRALFLARSGLEDAQARLGCGQDPTRVESRYGGEDWDADGTLNGIEASDEVVAVGRLNVWDCPVPQAMRPSFHAKDGFGAPVLNQVDGRRRGITGSNAAGSYSLKVVPQGGIHLNDGDPSLPRTAGYNAVLWRMLGNLAEAVDRQDGVVGDGPVARIDGENLVDRRPARGWQGWDQVREVALGGSRAKLEALRPCLTLQAWVDKRVIRPNATPGMLGGQPLTWAEIKGYGGRGAPAFEPRAPVNLGWARIQRPLLLALLTGLEGMYLNERDAQQEVGGDRVGTLSAAVLGTSWSTTDDCHRVADHLMAWTSDLDTWEQWNACCNAIPDVLLTGTSDEMQAKRDLLKANFNPNSDLNKFNPNASHWKTVDKQDLLGYSTEFSLLALHGFEVASAGRVLDGQGRLQALRQCRLTVSGPSAVRLSTQKEFVCADLGSPDLPGDEVGPRLPGAAAYLSFSTGLPLPPTWGAKIPAVGGNGISLQTYPEPCTNPGSGLQVRPADYDGNLQLATVETPPDALYGVTATTQDMKLLACFDDTLDLENPGTDVPGPNLPDLQQVTTAELGNSLLDPVKPNTLYPDGVYSEKDRTPSYLDAGNSDGFHGLMSFWMKPNYDPMKSQSNFKGNPNSRGRRFICRTNFQDLSNPGGVDQFFSVAEMRWLGGINFMFEVGHSGGDNNNEHRFKALRKSTPHCWRLLTNYWDFEDSTPLTNQYVGEMVSNDGAVAFQDDGFRADYGAVNAPANAADITLPDALGAHRLWLGPSHQRELNHAAFLGSGADATLDELAIYDFGMFGTDDTLQTTTFGRNRYREGRYYKGAAYRAYAAAAVLDEAPSYLSPPLRLPADAKLLQVGWSFSRPAELPDDYAAVELVKEDLLAPGYLWSAAASSSPVSPTGPQRWDIGLRLPGAFRARVLFLRRSGASTDANGTLDLNTPILDSPVFDDLTFVYRTRDGVRVLAWENGE